jgi:anaerobic magnesium-protoporphyrin IX monomethyl ester cyclase
MKVMLVFPPPWTPAMPYLALPVLTSVLRSHGVEVIQRDLNLETYDTVLSRAYLEQSLEHLRDAYPRGRRHNRAAPEKVEWAFAEGPQLAAQVDAAKDVFRSPAFYDGPKSLEAFTVIMRSLELASLPFAPAQLDFLYYQNAAPVDNSRLLVDGVRDAKHNLFLEIFRRGILADIVRERPDIIGISIPTMGQMLAGMTLAHLVKQTGLPCHITVGGPHISMLREQIPLAPLLFELIDSAVLFDGETPLLRLAEALDGKGDLSQISNLVVRANGQIHANTTAMHVDPATNMLLNPEPAHSEASKNVLPDFDGLPLGRYFVPDLVLPLVTAHGCYHGLCAFCNVGYGAGKSFVPFAVEQLVEQMMALHQKYGARHIFFTDEAIPPRTMRLLSARLTELGSPVDWCSCARLEKVISAELLQNLSRAGCRMLFYGLETASERMIEHMVKGTRRETMSRILHEGTQAGIWNHTFFFFGFPTETVADAQETVNFLYAHQDAVHSAGFGAFVLERYSPAQLDPARFGIKRVFDKPERDLAIYFEYEPESGIDESMARTLVDRFIDSLPGKRYGQYYTHDVHRFLYASHLHARGEKLPVWLADEGLVKA